MTFEVFDAPVPVHVEVSGSVGAGRFDGPNEAQSLAVLAGPFGNILIVDLRGPTASDSRAGDFLLQPGVYAIQLRATVQADAFEFVEDASESGHADAQLTITFNP